MNTRHNEMMLTRYACIWKHDVVVYFIVCHVCVRGYQLSFSTGGVWVIWLLLKRDDEQATEALGLAAPAWKKPHRSVQTGQWTVTTPEHVFFFVLHNNSEQHPDNVATPPPSVGQCYDMSVDFCIRFYKTSLKVVSEVHLRCLKRHYVLFWRINSTRNLINGVIMQTLVPHN